MTGKALGRGRLQMTFFIPALTGSCARLWHVKWPTNVQGGLCRCSYVSRSAVTRPRSSPSTHGRVAEPYAVCVARAVSAVTAAVTAAVGSASVAVAGRIVDIVVFGLASKGTGTMSRATATATTEGLNAT